MSRRKIVPRRHHIAEQRSTASYFIDNASFALSVVASLWLAWLVLTESLNELWYVIPFLVVFWLVLAYLVLPRLHRVLTSIYVPDYFIGRARTSDGLLGDPINVAVEGSEAQIHAAMTAAHWIRADDVDLHSGWKIVTSTVLRKSYDEAPVSPLLLFGRQQDFAYQQEVAGNPAKRHHVRFWRCPEDWLLPGGSRVDWLAAGTFDRAVGFSLFTLQITHKIDANTDIERDHIVRTVLAAEVAAEVRTLEDFSTGYHSRNGGGDSIETDGNLPILELDAVDSAAAPPFVPAPDKAAARLERRPLSTMLGTLLMVLRVVVSAVVVAEIYGDRLATLATDPGELGVDAADMPFLDLVLLVVMGLAALWALFYLFLSVKVFQGRNWARITAMAFNALLIIISGISFATGTGESLLGDIFGLPLDILILVALSAPSSSQWARRRRGNRAPTTPAAENLATHAG